MVKGDCEWFKLNKHGEKNSENGRKRAKMGVNTRKWTAGLKNC